MSEDIDYQISRIAGALEDNDRVDTIHSHLKYISDALANDDGSTGGVIGDLSAAVESGCEKLRTAICRPGIPADGIDGGKVGDFTEAVMDVAVGLKLVAGAIERLADAHESSDETDETTGMSSVVLGYIASVADAKRELESVKREIAELRAKAARP